MVHAVRSSSSWTAFGGCVIAQRRYHLVRREQRWQPRTRRSCRLQRWTVVLSFDTDNAYRRFTIRVCVIVTGKHESNRLIVTNAGMLFFLRIAISSSTGIPDLGVTYNPFRNHRSRLRRSVPMHAGLMYLPPDFLHFHHCWPDLLDYNNGTGMVRANGVAYADTDRRISQIGTASIWAIRPANGKRRAEKKSARQKSHLSEKANMSQRCGVSFGVFAPVTWHNILFYNNVSPWL